MADPKKAALKSRSWGAFFIGPALVCLETCDPEMTTKETGPKAAFQSRRWVAYFIRLALVCLETGKQPGDDNEKNDPKATQKRSRPWAAFF